MTDVELDALEAAAKAATPGPWKHYNNKGNDCVTVFGKVFLPRNELSVADTAFIAAANPSVVLDLIAELRQTRAERDWLAAMLSEACARNDSCPFTHWHCGIKQLSCSSACVQDWLAAAKEATCPKN